jgi:hypothetical protein
VNGFGPPCGDVERRSATAIVLGAVLAQALATLAALAACGDAELTGLDVDQGLPAEVGEVLLRSPRRAGASLRTGTPWPPRAMAMPCRAAATRRCDLVLPHCFRVVSISRSRARSLCGSARDGG